MSLPADGAERSAGAAPDSLSIERGALMVYRLFDVGDSISLDQAATRVLRGETRRLDLRRIQRNTLSISVPPLSYELGQQRLSIDGNDLAIDSHVRIFDIGVLSVVLKVAIPRGTTLAELVQLNARVAASAAVEKLAKDLAQQVADDIRAVTVRPKISGFIEDYCIIFIQAFDRAPDIDALAASPALPQLLLNETSTRPIAREVLEDAAHMRFSYYADELVLIDYNAAFVFDAGGDTDIADLIEFASAQLLELRYYDDLLDRSLSQMYAEMEKVRGKMRKQELRSLIRRVLTVVLDVTELTEKIDNSLKWVGDHYLAKLYQAAAKQFQLERWQHQVERKVSLMTKLSELLTDQINTDRALLLETLVVILILLEIVLAIFRH